MNCCHHLERGVAVTEHHSSTIVSNLRLWKCFIIAALKMRYVIKQFFLAPVPINVHATAFTLS